MRRTLPVKADFGDPAPLFARILRSSADCSDSERPAELSEILAHFSDISPAPIDSWPDKRFLEQLTEKRVSLMSTKYVFFGITRTLFWIEKSFVRSTINLSGRHIGKCAKTLPSS